MESIFILEVSAVVVRIARVDDMLVRDISYLFESLSRLLVEGAVYAYVVLNSRSFAINRLDSVSTCLHSR